MEIWKDIEGFDGKYQISTWGRVRNNENQILTPYRNAKGYLKISLCNGGKSPAKFRIHRLVAMAFIPNPKGLPQVNHKDGNKENNSYTNLEWLTNEMNQEHRKLMRKGVLQW